MCVTYHCLCADYASESDSDHEGMKVQEIWKTDEETDMESLDSEQEDPLK